MRTSPFWYNPTLAPAGKPWIAACGACANTRDAVVAAAAATPVARTGRRLESIIGDLSCRWPRVRPALSARAAATVPGMLSAVWLYHRCSRSGAAAGHPRGRQILFRPASSRRAEKSVRASRIFRLAGLLAWILMPGAAAAAPDEALLGQAESYPVCRLDDANIGPDRCLVGLFSYFAEAHPVRQVARGGA